MDIKIDPSYKKESVLIRYASLLFNYKEGKSAIGEKLIKAANELKFFAYPVTLINNSTETFLSSSLKPFLTQNNSEKLVLDMNQKDSHFIDSIGVSDIDKNIDNILKAYNNFYDCGNFYKLIRACYRFLKRIKGANEYDINDVVIRYMISCICMNDYSNCLDIIKSIGQNYVLFDYNIYIFLVYFIQGNFIDACEYILLIKNNINENFYELINEKDLAFYFSFCLLYDFKVQNYKKVLSNNELLVYKLYDKYNEFFKIIDEYFRCDYLKVNNTFNKELREKIQKDAFLAGFLEKIEEKFKNKILKEILSFSSEISLETISNLLLLKSKDKALDMVTNLIKKEKFNAVIDDIDGIVIVKEKNPFNEIFEKSNKIMRNNLNDLVKFSLNKTIKHKLLSKQYSNMEGVEKKVIGGEREHEIGNDMMMRMAMALRMGY